MLPLFMENFIWILKQSKLSNLLKAVLLKAVILIFVSLFLPQEIPTEAGEQQDGYVLLLVILSVFLVGTLISISVFLVVYRRCCRGGTFCDRYDIKNNVVDLL